MPNPYTTRGVGARAKLRATPDIQTGAQQTTAPPAVNTQVRPVEGNKPGNMFKPS